ncbi:MAG: 2-succinyl-5-enolpyruvyl-6-hydroxy-3-cyclohexene-1-carboxylic-acid synthase [Akkermansia sp.]
MPRVSNKPVVQELAALMAAHGVRRCVLCPGSRNAPITATLSALPELFECRAATDERSAGFAALGWAAQCGEPVAVCVTSGSALLNLHPAVAEAFYRHLPLVVLSADRPAEAIGQQRGQTLPQPGVYGALVRAAVQLPEDNLPFANRLINEALLALRHHGGGPVHLNVPLSEPLFGQTELRALPPARVIRRTEAARCTEAERAALRRTLRGCPRRMILCGQMSALPPGLPEFAAAGGFALVGEHLCNAPRGACCVFPDAVLGPAPEASLSPELLVTLGGCVVSKRLHALLRAHPPREHWHLSPDGAVVDTFGALTRVVEGQSEAFFALSAPLADGGDATYAARWRCPEPPPLPAGYGAAQLVAETLAALPPGSVLHLANSSAVRYAQLVALPEGTQTECNRGVNGIEGSLSAALGYAAGDARLNLVLIGDLSFFYDMNALWLPGVGSNLRVLLLHNGGGGIFDTLPMPPNDFVRAPHRTDAAAWARSRGWEVHTVRCRSEWPGALAALLSPNAAAPVLVQAMTDAAADAALLREFRSKY